jgi:hypothetical protein
MINKLEKQVSADGRANANTRLILRRFTMKQFDFETFKETLNPAKFIDQAEKNTQAVLAYVEPKELSKTLVSFTSDVSNFARAQVETFASITNIVKAQAEEVTAKFTKAVK